MDDFVKKAFADANEQFTEKERQAFDRAVVDDDAKTVTVLAALNVGLTTMQSLLNLVNDAGMQDAFADYIGSVSLISFHLGYLAAKEDA